MLGPRLVNQRKDFYWQHKLGVFFPSAMISYPVPWLQNQLPGTFRTCFARGIFRQISATLSSRRMCQRMKPTPGPSSSSPLSLWLPSLALRCCLLRICLLLPPCLWRETAGRSHLLVKNLPQCWTKAACLGTALPPSAPCLHSHFSFFIMQASAQRSF